MFFSVINSDTNARQITHTWLPRSGHLWSCASHSTHLPGNVPLPSLSRTFMLTDPASQQTTFSAGQGRAPCPPLPHVQMQKSGALRLRACSFSRLYFILHSCLQERLLWITWEARGRASPGGHAEPVLVCSGLGFLPGPRLNTARFTLSVPPSRTR